MSEIPSVELRAVEKAYSSRHGDVQAVQPTDLSIRTGEFFSLLGPSGCGKSTTLRMIAGFEEPTAGSILLGEDDVTQRPPNERDVNLVFQNYALFPHLDVAGNIAFGLKRRKVSKKEISARVGEVLELVSLTGYEHRRPHEMSGGQQQRVAVARALVNRPAVLLLDEPLGALDLKLRQSMQVELKRIQREVGITFIYVTHDQGEALAMSDRVAVMNEGVIEQVAAPREVYDHPSTAFVADFIGVSNLIRRTVTEISQGSATLESQPDDRLVIEPSAAESGVGSVVTFAVRPENLSISDAVPGDSRCRLAAQVVEVTYQGPSTIYLLTTQGGDSVTAMAPSASPERWERGAKVWLGWNPADVALVREP